MTAMNAHGVKHVGFRHLAERRPQEGAVHAHPDPDHLDPAVQQVHHFRGAGQAEDIVQFGRGGPGLAHHQVHARIR